MPGRAWEVIYFYGGGGSWHAIGMIARRSVEDALNVVGEAEGGEKVSGKTDSANLFVVEKAVRKH